jgi:hypothetical protein
MLDRDLYVGGRLLDDRFNVGIVGIFEDVADPAVPLARQERDGPTAGEALDLIRQISGLIILQPTGNLANAARCLLSKICHRPRLIRV